MTRGAQSPEELDSLLEDAILLGDADAIAALFTHHGAFAASGMAPVCRGSEMIDVLSSWTEHGHGYIGGSAHVVRSRRTALVIGESAINVVRRGRNGMWRFAICLVPNTDGI